MPTIPILKRFHLRNLPTHFPDIKVTHDFSPIVNVTVADVTVQCHRVDLITHDCNGREWNVYVYTDKAKTFLYAIDGVSTSTEATRDSEKTYDSLFAPLISHFHGGMEPPRFGEPAQLLGYPEILHNNSFYMEDVLYVSTLSVEGPHVDTGPTVTPGRLYQPRVDANDEEHHPMYVLYENCGCLKLLILA